MEKPTSDRVIKSLIAPAAVWAVSLLLDRPRVKGALQEMDSRAFIERRKAIRRARRVGRNAIANPAWLAAGAAAIAVGIGLMAKAAANGKSRK